MNHNRYIGRQKRRRRWRVRKGIRGTSARPRLSVFRSHKHIYAQVIDDLDGKTLVSANTTQADLSDKGTYGGNKDAATLVGKRIAQRALAAGIKQVAFDRGHFKYHGRIASLADAAREAGLSF